MITIPREEVETEENGNYESIYENGQSNYESNQVTDQATDQARPIQLTNKQKDIIHFCSIPRTAAEIYKRAGVTKHKYNRQTYITSLIAAGRLEMTIPENPTDPNQKYVRKRKK